MKSKIVKNLKYILPPAMYRRVKKIYKSYKSFLLKKKIVLIEDKHQVALSEIRKKDTVKVAFLVINASVWKYDNLFKEMLLDPLFEPVIVVCPLVNYGHEAMIQTLYNTFDIFESKGYKTINTLNDKTGTWLDLKKELNPDIIFFTNPHRLTKEEYYITNFTDSLTCYVQYSLHVSHLNEMQYNQFFHNVVWKIFSETPIHQNLAQKHATNKGKNAVFTGYPGVDKLINKNNEGSNLWGDVKNRKKIIWSPHHTIYENDSLLGYSNFLDYYEIFISILKEFKDDIIVCFKPHPMLKLKLYNDSDWGKLKTDKYYELWSSSENSILNEGPYIDFFNSSDAIVNDSGSFLAEYLYVNKPNLFMVKNQEVLSRFNVFGKMCLEVTYKSYTKLELYEFIKNIVLKEKDPLKQKRNEFVKEYMMPPNGRSASINILKHIKDEIEKVCVA